MTPLTHTRDRRSRRSPAPRSFFLDFLESRQLLTGNPNAPVLTDVPESGTETIAARFSLADFVSHFSDPNPGASLQSITILDTTFSNGTILFNGLPVAGNRTFAASDIPRLAFDGQFGIDNIPFTASDGTFTSNVANITVNIARSFVGGIPPGIQDSSVTDAGGAPLTLSLTDFHSHDADGDSTNYQYFQVVSLPTHGTLLSNGTPVTAGEAFTNFGVMDPSQSLSFTYVPAPGFAGTDSFLWNGANVYGYDNHNATFSINVQQQPTAGNIARSATITSGVQFSLADFTSVFADANPGATLQSITITSLPAHGNLVLNNIGGSVAVNQTISAGNISSLSFSGPGGDDAFTFTASDGQFSTAPATVSIHTESRPVLSSLHAVVLPNGHLTVGSNGTSAVLSALSIFSDADGDTPQTVQITRLPSRGKLLLRGAALHLNQVVAAADLANITYSATAANIQDSFALNISDGTDDASTPATISLLDFTSPITLLGQNVAIGNNQPPTTANFTDFGTWTTGANPSLEADTRTYTLYNTSGRNIPLSAITIGGAAPHDFLLINSPAGTTLAPGQGATFSIRFAPKAAGLRKATLTIPIGSGLKPLIIQLAATGLVSRTIHTDPAGAGGIVQVATTQAGKGAAAANGQILSISYTGYLADGTIFDSSAAHPTTAKTGLTFRLDDAYGQNQPFINKDKALPVEQTVDIAVIAGWEFGLQGIKVGEKRTLIMNAAAAYGAQGNGLIPPNATIRFDVQCLAIQAKPQLLVNAIVPGIVFTVGNPPTPGPVAVTPGQTRISAAAGTLLSLTANQTSTSQQFSTLSLFSDNASGVSLANVTLSSITLTGANAKDFSITRSGSNFTLTFHPATVGARNATVHLHSNDPLHPDFTFAVQGRSGNAALALLAVK